MTIGIMEMNRGDCGKRLCKKFPRAREGMEGAYIDRVQFSNVNENRRGQEVHRVFSPTR